MGCIQENKVCFIFRQQIILSVKHNSSKWFCFVSVHNCQAVLAKWESSGRKEFFITRKFYNRNKEFGAGMVAQMVPPFAFHELT